MNRIKKLSGLLRWVFVLAFVSIPLVQGVGWLLLFDGATASGLGRSMIPAAIRESVQILHAVSWQNRGLALLVSLLPGAMSMLVCWNLVRLFSAYARGMLFTEMNALYIKRAGIWLVARQLFDPFYGALLSVILTLDNPPGQRMLTLGLGSTNLLGVLVGLLIILVAWIMQEGCRLQEENALTI